MSDSMSDSMSVVGRGGGGEIVQKTSLIKFMSKIHLFRMGSMMT